MRLATEQVANLDESSDPEIALKVQDSQNTSISTFEKTALARQLKQSNIRGCITSFTRCT